MNTKRIEEFTTTASYEHLKLRSPGHLPHSLLILGLDDVPTDTNPRWLKNDIVYTFTDPSINLKNMSRINTTDGIYDIWLRNVENLQSITIHVQNVGVVYEDHNIQKSTHNYQIPLAFDRNMNDDGVTSYFCEYRDNMNMFHVSWIPSFLFQYNDFIITLNDGAKADLCLSTVYFAKNKRKQLAQHTNKFYIHGKTYYSDGGCFSKNKRTMCVIS